METKIIIDLLTENSVSIVRVVQTTYNGKIVELERTRKAYDNSNLGRQKLLQEVGNPYYTSIIAIWGTTPTVADPPTPEILKEVKSNES